MLKKMLVGYDDSPGAKRALEAACELAKALGAELWAVAVLEHLPKYAASVGEIEETQAQGQTYLREVLNEAQETALARGLGLQVDQLAGQPAQAIVKYAKERAFDLIVLGHSGHSGIWGTFLGTTADKAARHAHCSVLVVR
jgi:nucleotide-binding universal stress UspA family protein